MKLAQTIVLGYYRNKFNTLSIFSPRKAAELAFRLFCTPYTRKRNYKAPAIFNKAERLTLTFDNDTVEGFRWKPGAYYNGKKILICHGFDSYSYRFDKYVAALLNEGFEVLAFDAPAHGISKGETITILQYRNMIVQTNKKYGPVDGVIAHSFGGLAIAIALEQMEENQIKQLVLIAPATETTHAIDEFFKFVKINSKVRAEFNKLIEEFGGNPASWFSIARVMQNVHVPTLWVHDKEDTITPYDHVHPLTLKNLPHIHFEITQGLGHSLYNETEVMNRVVAWIAHFSKV